VSGEERRTTAILAEIPDARAATAGEQGVEELVAGSGTAGAAWTRTGRRRRKRSAVS